MRIVAKLNIKGDLVSRALKDKYLLKVANVAREIIIDETERGIFTTGENFKYSISRKKVREKQGLQTKFVDMIDTGETVIKGIQIVQERNGDVSLVLKEGSNAWNRERWNRNRYNFFAINDKRQKEIDKVSIRIAKETFK